jgi:hypothetical protein
MTTASLAPNPLTEPGDEKSAPTPSLRHGKWITTTQRT